MVKCQIDLIEVPIGEKGVIMDNQTQTEIESAVLRRLIDHLGNRTDVQNIDMMNLAGFCRNCLSRWYAEAAAEKGILIDKLESREIIYGMPFEEWKKLYQKEASPEQQKKFQETHKEV